MRISKCRGPESQPKMEGTVCLVAEWISVEEMKALQSACMLCLHKGARKGV